MGGGKASANSSGGGGGGGYIGRRYDASGQFAQTKGQQSVVAKSEGGGENADKGFSTSSGSATAATKGDFSKQNTAIARAGAEAAAITALSTGGNVPLSALGGLTGAGYERYKQHKETVSPYGTPTISAMGQKRSFSTPRAIGGLLDDEGAGSGVGGFDAGGYTSQDAASARGGKL